MKFRVGIIGATGYIAAAYRAEMRASPDDARIVALCSRRRPLLEAAAAEDQADLVTDDWRQVIEHPEVNLVVVATPDALHHQAVMACAAAGKHLVCEKPLGMTIGEARDMRTAYVDSGLGHFVPFWTRYVPVFRRAREVVRQGVLGELKSIVFRWHNPRPAAMPFTWRDDATLSAAGSLADLGSHIYDTIRWLTGMDAARVLAHGGVLGPSKPDLGDVNLAEALQWGGSHSPGESDRRRSATAFDFAAVTLAYENGAVGSVLLSHATFVRKGLAPDTELHGTDASLAVDRASGRLTLVRTGKDPELLDTLPDPGFGNRFGKYVFPALRASIGGETTEHPGLDDGWHAQCFTDAALISAQQGAWAPLAGK